jgi:hypothetical protein
VHCRSLVSDQSKYYLSRHILIFNFEIGRLIVMFYFLKINAQLNTVVIEVTHASPKITAMEFFDVNRRLLPTVLYTITIAAACSFYNKIENVTLSFFLLYYS